VPNGLAPAELRKLRSRILIAADTMRDERQRSGYHIPYAGEEYVWGSNSNILNRALVLAVAYDIGGDVRNRGAVVDAMDYVLGRNPLDQSYVSGYGERTFRNPHHRFWAPSFDTGLPPPPPGALSGGPNTNNPASDEVAKEIIDSCAPQTCWRDDVRAYSLNEVAINWNAPLVWVAAFLDSVSP
jgi:endoglucanase